MAYDVTIVGGAIVGAALARALNENRCLEIALVESDSLQNSQDGDWDSRIYAISPGSAAFLKEQGIWQHLDADRVVPVYEMRIFGDDGNSRLTFSAYDAGLPELAFIVENRHLRQAISQSLTISNNVRQFCPAKCVGMDCDSEFVTLNLDNGVRLESRLIVGADGAGSWVRLQSGIDAEQVPYRQTAVVANFETEKYHRNIAWQWFRQDGVLALLPLPGNRVSIVWSTGETQAQDLLLQEPHDISTRVEEACHRVLGALRLITSARGFPLQILKVKKLVASRIVLIGDAAHVIHPLAGQGVNLGIQDARELSRVLQCRSIPFDCGSYTNLRRYERARKEEILAMQLTTDTLQKLFDNPNDTLSLMRNFGFRLIEKLPLIKNLFTHQALG